MKILFDYQTFVRQEFGGISRYFVELMEKGKNIDDLNIDVDVIRSSNYYLSELKGITRYDNSNKIKRYFSLIINSIHSCANFVIRHKKYDIVHLTWYKTSYIKFAMLFMKTKPKIVVTIHDLIHEMEQNERRVYRRGVKDRIRALKLADGIICISDNTKKDLLKYYPWISEDKIYVVYHGVSKYSERKIKKFPEKYVLYVGKREGYKNFANAVKAFSILPIAGEKIYLICVGGGKFTEQELTLLNELGIKNKVRQFTLTDEELAYAYSHAICFIFPSKYEGFGMPILESFTYGCPAAISNTSCFPEIAGDAALYFDENSTKDIAEKMEMLVVSQKKRNELITKGYERVSLFSWEIAAQKTYMVYEKMMSI